MDEQQLKKLIKKILLEQYSKKVLVILTGANTYEEEILKILKKCECVDYWWIASPNRLHLKNEEWENLGKQIKEIDKVQEWLQQTELVVLPFLTRNTLAKTALGIADNLVTTSLQLALMMGKKVVAVENCWHPESEKNKIMQLNQNTAYTKMLLQYEKTVAEFGVKSVSVYELEQVLKTYLNEKVVLEQPGHKEKSNKASFVGGYITCEQVIGKETVYLPADKRLTDLAKDYVKEYQIKVVEE